MNKKALEVFAKQAAKSIKTESDLTDFRKMLTNITLEAALNAELDEHLVYSHYEQALKMITVMAIHLKPIGRKVVKST